jgi:hypothetical protein
MTLYEKCKREMRVQHERGLCGSTLRWVQGATNKYDAHAGWVQCIKQMVRDDMHWCYLVRVQSYMLCVGGIGYMCYWPGLTDDLSEGTDSLWVLVLSEFVVDWHHRPSVSGDGCSVEAGQRLANFGLQLYNSTDALVGFPDTPVNWRTLRQCDGHSISWLTMHCSINLKSKTQPRVFACVWGHVGVLPRCLGVYLGNGFVLQVQRVRDS